MYCPGDQVERSVTARSGAGRLALSKKRPEIVKQLNRRLCVAPMMERTDRHCRYLLRLVAPRAWLYTEMVTATALARGDWRRLLEFHPSERPVALQLGGNDPGELAAAARLGADAGYDEINLNVGCPSDRVQAGCFGAALMREPSRVAACVAAMRAAVAIPVTVKTRLGVDDCDDYRFLEAFVAEVAAAGCRTVIVHARKAWLRGLSPKENREIPPLDYGRVHRVKADFPELEVIINGGLTDVETALEQLRCVDGVMLGRAAYANPMLLGALDAAIYGGIAPARAAVLDAYVAYIERELSHGTPLKAMTRHLLGLYCGQRGGRHWRRRLGELSPGLAGSRRLRALVDEQRDTDEVATIARSIREHFTHEVDL
jgi:tRNA-dihydrouridine synthase A